MNEIKKHIRNDERLSNITHLITSCIGLMLFGCVQWSNFKGDRHILPTGERHKIPSGGTFIQEVNDGEMLGTSHGGLLVYYHNCRDSNLQTGELGMDVVYNSPKKPLMSKVENPEIS